MVAGPRRMSSTSIKRQLTNQQKRKCTRADPTQTRILLENYDTEARPSAEQFLDLSQKTKLCVVVIVFAAVSDTVVCPRPCAFVCSFPTLVEPPRRPVDWIKKWFVRKRTADSKNKPPAPAEPTFAENGPPANDGQALGHAHSKFWGMDSFAAADSTSFSPSVGRIPKFYGHRKHGLPPVNADDSATDSRENEERVISPPGSGYGYAAPLDSVLARESAEIATMASYNLREVLLGADAFTGYVSPSANGNMLTTPPPGHPDVRLMVDDPEPTLLLPAALSPEPSPYPVGLYEERSATVTESELTPINHPFASVPSPLDTIDDLFAASAGHDFIPTTSDDLELGAFGSTTGCLDSDLGSLPGFSNPPDYMVNILDEHSAFFESLLSQTKQDPVGDSTDAANRSNLLGIDFCLGAGADHFAFTLTGFEFCE